jgi:hypothetical protein
LIYFLLNKQAAPGNRGDEGERGYTAICDCDDGIDEELGPTAIIRSIAPTDNNSAETANVHGRR